MVDLTPNVLYNQGGELKPAYYSECGPGSGGGGNGAPGSENYAECGPGAASGGAYHGSVPTATAAAAAYEMVPGAGGAGSIGAGGAPQRPPQPPAAPLGMAAASVLFSVPMATNDADAGGSTPHVLIAEPTSTHTAETPRAPTTPAAPARPLGPRPTARRHQERAVAASSFANAVYVTQHPEAEPRDGAGGGRGRRGSGEGSAGAMSQPRVHHVAWDDARGARRSASSNPGAALPVRSNPEDAAATNASASGSGARAQAEYGQVATFEQEDAYYQVPLASASTAAAASTSAALTTHVVGEVYSVPSEAGGPVAGSGHYETAGGPGGGVYVHGQVQPGQQTESTT